MKEHMVKQQSLILEAFETTQQTDLPAAQHFPAHRAKAAPDHVRAQARPGVESVAAPSPLSSRSSVT